MSRASLDVTDPEAVARWLAGLRSAFNDCDAVALDMLRPPRSRELGPAIHTRNYTAAREQVLQALDFAARPEPSNPVTREDTATRRPDRERDEALASLGAEVIAHRALRCAWTETRAENDRLRAEVERLRAGPPPNDPGTPDDPAGGEL